MKNLFKFFVLLSIAAVISCSNSSKKTFAKTDVKDVEEVVVIKGNEKINITEREQIREVVEYFQQPELYLAKEETALIGKEILYAISFETGKDMLLFSIYAPINEKLPVFLMEHDDLSQITMKEEVLGFVERQIQKHKK